MPLFPHLNVFNNIAYGLKLQKLPKDEIEERVNQALKAVQMDDFAVRVPSQMSGGQQQRVALARALVMEPTVLLFDEPLSNLDAKLRIHMRDEIRRIQRDVGITTVYVTHDQSEAMAMSDKIVILKDGLVQQIDSPQRIYQRPNNVFISNFIGKANIIGGTIISCENNRAEIDIEGITFSVPEKIEYKAGTKVEIVIRPESVLVGEKRFYCKGNKKCIYGINARLSSRI